MMRAARRHAMILFVRCLKFYHLLPDDTTDDRLHAEISGARSRYDNASAFAVYDDEI